MARFPIVRVTWVDSCTVDKWTPLHDSDFEPIRCESVGFLVKDSEGFVAIAASIANGVEGGQACQVMCIPKAAVVRSEVLEAGDA